MALAEIDIKLLSCLCRWLSMCTAQAPTWQRLRPRQQGEGWR
jgi:hypothetical protein